MTELRVKLRVKFASILDVMRERFTQTKIRYVIQLTEFRASKVERPTRKPSERRDERLIDGLTDIGDRMILVTEELTATISN